MSAAATPDELARFRAEVEAFLRSHCPPRRADTEFVWGVGSDDVGMFEERDAAAEREHLARAKAWRATLFDAGLGWITGPTDLGGRGLGPEYQRVFDSVADEYETPDLAPFVITDGMVAPTILAHALPAVQREYLPRLWRGDLVACQLFSEPGAGSDLASVQTSAVRDGDSWIVTGQKVWTSGAHYADIGEILTRTAPDAPKHRGMTMFLLDMHAPGVEIRPLRQMTGGAAFNEVFLSEVRIPDSHRLGGIDDGWRVSLTTLMNERMAIGGGEARGFQRGIDRLVHLARHLGRHDDAVVRQSVADYYVHARATLLCSQRAAATVQAGRVPGPELSIGKLAGSRNGQRLTRLVSELLGPRLAADTGEWGTYAWADLVLGYPGGRIAGGSDEIMRNILGERVLGLPKEPTPSH